MKQAEAWNEQSDTVLSAVGVFSSTINAIEIASDFRIMYHFSWWSYRLEIVDPIEPPRYYIYPLRVSGRQPFDRDQ